MALQSPVKDALRSTSSQVTNIVCLHLGKLLGYERSGQDQTLHRDRSVTLGFFCSPHPLQCFCGEIIDFCNEWRRLARLTSEWLQVPYEGEFLGSSDSGRRVRVRGSAQ